MDAQAEPAADPVEESSKPTLLRQLGTWDVALITFNAIVGSAIFIAAGIVPRSVSSPSLILALWVIGSLLSVAGAVTYAELGTMFPRAGGLYQYLKEAYGPLWGFLFGWTSFFVMQSGAIAYLGVAAADGIAGVWPGMALAHMHLVIPIGPWTWQPSGVQLGAAALIGALTIVNYVGLRSGATVQNAIGAIKILSLVAFILCGFAVTMFEPRALAGHAPEGSGALIAPGIGVAMIGVLWCFDGWYTAAFCAGEIRNPGRCLPRGMIFGTLATGVLLLLVNVVYLRAMTPQALGDAPRIGEAAATSLFGPDAARLMSLAVLVSIVGCLAACILGAARIYQPMADDGLFFKRLAAIHPRYRTPAPSLVAQAVWSIVLAFSGTYEELGTYVIFAVFLFHAATGAAVILLRQKRPDWPRSYRAWGYPWTPVVFILTSLAFVVSTMIERPLQSLLGLGIVAIGVPAYARWRRLIQLTT